MGKILNRSKLFIGLVLVMSVLGFTTLISFADRSSSVICSSSGQPNDVNFFPFKFTCGSKNPTTPPSADLAFYNGTPAGKKSGTTLTTVTNTSTGKTLFFQGKYDPTMGGFSQGDGVPKGYNKTPSTEVLVWATIDANPSLIGNAGDGFNNVAVVNNPVGSDAGVVDKCPGIGSGKYAPVYNYRDIQSNGSYGINQSPAAWDPSQNRGKEDCGNEGQMVYWGHAKPSNDYKFNVNLNPNAEGQVCVRLNYSVRFNYVDPGYKYSEPYFEPSDATKWNDPSNPSGYANTTDQHSVASHVVQQSDENCYQVVKTPTPVNKANCSRFDVGLDGNSWYRFTAFHEDKNYIPANQYYTGYVWKTTSSTQSPPGWSNFTQTPDAQTRGGFGTNKTTSALNTALYTDWSQYGSGWSAVETTQTLAQFANPDLSGPDRVLYVEHWQHKDVDNDGDLDWVYTRDRPNINNCYTASCSIQISAGLGSDPNGLLAGQNFVATVTIANTGNAVLPAITQGKTLTFSGTGTNLSTGSSYPPWNKDLAQFTHFIVPDQTYTESFNLSAPASAGTFSLSGKITFPGVFDLYGGPRADGSYWGSPCNSPSVNVYKPFTLSAFGEGNYDDDEDPANFTFKTWVNNNSGQGVNISPQSYSCVFKAASSVAGDCPPSITPQVNKGSLANGDNYFYGSVSTKDSTPVTRPINAGDKYCVKLYLPYTSGFVDVNGNVRDGINPYSNNWCDTVVNKPFFKVTGNGVSVGSNFKSQSCNGTGILAAYFNYKKDPETLIRYGYGSSAQYQALSKDKNLSFASKQVIPFKSPTELTFANTGAQAAPSGEGDYGGNFGSSPCLPDFEDLDVDQSIAQPVTGNSLGRIDITDPDKVIIYKTTGDVTITDDITNSASVSPGHAPIFILYTTGNINIAPNVKELYGQYFAQSTGNNSGTITTCADASGPINKTANYNSCTNQLVVRGNFVARKVNMNRTFGSLRDEKPTPGQKAQPITGQNGIHKPLVWINNSTGSPAGYKKCQQIVEPSEPRGATWLYENPTDTTTVSTGWDDNWICLPKDDEDGGLQLTWSRGGAGSPKPTTGSCSESIGQVIKDATGQTEKGWSDNYLCINDSAIKIKAIVSFNDPSDSKTLCTRLLEPNDSHASNVWKDPRARVATQKMYICVDKFVPGTSTAEVPPQAPNPLLCSVPGGQQASPYGTCAAEIFKFNPSMYLAKPLKGASGSNSIKFDAITSLPPVL